MLTIIFFLERVIALAALPGIVTGVAALLIGSTLARLLPNRLPRAFCYGLLGGGATVWDYATYETWSQEYAEAPLWVLISLATFASVFWTLISYSVLSFNDWRKRRKPA